MVLYKWTNIRQSSIGIIVVFFFLLLTGCGSSPSDNPDTSTPPLGEDTGVGIAPNSLFVSEGALGAGLEDVSSQLLSREFQQMLALDPIGQKRCDFPEEGAFAEVADSLGGFQKPYRIPIARDESMARYYSGRIPYSNRNNYADEPMASNASVTIERGDLIGRFNNTAFYLAKPHGLIAVNVNNEESQQSEVSCVFSLPGRPVNFYTDDNNLIVVINSTGKTQNSAVLKLQWADNNFKFDDILLIPNATIKDSRRFNETLVFLGDYYLGQSEEDNVAVSVPYFAPINHLTTVDVETLGLGWQETFDADDNGRYNRFLSATSQYLVLSANYREQVGTSNGSYSVCNAYGDPVSYQSCSVKWKKVPNPDYVKPVAQGGVVACGADLVSCFRQQGPRLSPYIYERDGQTCRTVTRTSCTGYHRVTYERPIYQNYTAFRVYRFEDGEFIKLDESLSAIEGEGLKLTEDRIHVEDRIVGHQYLHFQNDFFYVLSSEGNLTTFTIQGNSIIRTAKLAGLGNAIGSVEFSDQHMLLGRSGGFQTIDLSNPSAPQYGDFIAAPGQLNQLIFDEDYILGFGSIRVDLGNNSRNYFEKISLFSVFDSATVLDNYLVSTDLPHTRSVAHYDDQVFQYDADLNRLFLPVQSYGTLPGVGYQYKDRVVIVERNDELLTTPELVDLPERVERVLSLDESNALAFSKNYIYQLNKTDLWRKTQLQQLNTPKEVYPLAGTNYWVVYQTTESGGEFYTNVKSEMFNLPRHSQVDFMSAMSNVCIRQQIYFASDMVLVVSEKEGVYMDHVDCPEYGEDISLDAITIVGWKVTQDGEFEPASQQSLEAMFQQIQQVKGQYCVLDPSDLEGESIDVVESEDQYTCMDSSEFRSSDVELE